MSTPQDYRSTNADGRYTHFGGVVVAGVEFGRGIELNPNSTALTPNIMPTGDDANIGLGIVAKGTGKVTVGNSSNSVALLGTVQLGSTATGSLGFKGAFTALSTHSWAALTQGHATELTLSTATVQCDVGDVVSVGLVIDTANLSSQTGVAWWRLSTAASSRLTVALTNIGSTAGSTGSGTLQISWIDLT